MFSLSHLNGRTLAASIIGAGLAFAAPACGPEGAGTDTEAIETEPTDTMTEDAVQLPPEVTEAQAPPDPAILLPPLQDYVTDDRPDPGEIEASLEHSAVPWVDVRRRLILDEQAFTVGEVTVVTLEPGTAGGETYLDHRYGDAARRPVEIAGVEMVRIEAEPFDALAWTEPTFAVTFERGQERSDEWLEELARATVRAVAER